MIINNLKNTKKIIDKTMVSIGIAGKGVFCHIHDRRYLVELCPMMLKSDVSPEESRGQHDKGKPLFFPCYSSCSVPIISLLF